MPLSNSSCTKQPMKTNIEQFLKDAPQHMLPLDGWTMFVESSGGWCWSLDEETAIYASPFFDDAAGIPLEFCYDEYAEASASAFIPFALTGDLMKDIEQYRTLIRPYMALRRGQRAFENLPTL